MKPRQAALLEYLREVTRDLIIRGVLRKRAGQDVIEILQQEPSMVMSSIVRDLKDAGFSLKKEIAGGVVDAAKTFLEEFLFPTRKG